MKLDDHIKKNYDGNNSYFARSQGVSPSQVQRWLNRGCLIEKGVIYCQVSKQTKPTQVADS